MKCTQCEKRMVCNKVAENGCNSGLPYKTNFDCCCESVENMAQIIDVAKVGWTKEQVIEWLKTKVEE